MTYFMIELVLPAHSLSHLHRLTGVCALADSDEPAAAAGGAGAAEDRSPIKRKIRESLTRAPKQEEDETSAPTGFGFGAFLESIRAKY